MRMRRSAIIGLALLAAAYVVLLVTTLDASRDGPFDASKTKFGYNWPGDVGNTLRWGAVEMLVVLAILRPWSFHRSWLRALSAFVLMGSWAVLNIPICMHCGLIGIQHTFWLFGLALCLFLVLLWSAINRIEATSRAA